MKKILPVILMFIYACNSSTSVNPPLSEADSIERRQKIREQMETTIAEARNKVSESRKGISDSLSPVKIIKCIIVEDDYGSKSVKVTLKNTTKQTVDGIKVKWTLYNNFDESVDDYYSGGIVQEKIRAGKTDTYEWSIYRSNATKVKAYILSVHTAEGGKWAIE